MSRSAGMILFCTTPGGRRYLILRATPNEDRKKEFWDIPKGELDPGEWGIDAAWRELREEAGIEDSRLIPEFKFTARYFTKRDGKTIPKFVAVFLAEATTDTVRLSWEHDHYLWASFAEAAAKLTSLRPALEAADAFLNQ